MSNDEKDMEHADASDDLLRLLRAATAGGQPGLGTAAERYEVLGEVARGGMGVILKVRDRGFRRDLAMKVLPDETLEPDSSRVESQRASRFLDEAQVTGQLEHPGVIPVYEVGVDEQRRLFFTMRLVKGKTLSEVFKLAREGAEGWTATRALGVLLKVCETMAFAHDKGVVHRDLKPANVMVGRFGETYVMDWGLAKVTGDARQEARDATMHSVLTTARAEEGARGDSSHATLEGQVMGTPAYMPPEQARGEVQRLGPRSDVYSVGAMLYHLLVGNAPYADDGEKDALAILGRVKEAAPRALEEIAPGVSPELVAVCNKAMAREPEARYGSMLELADDLHAYLDDRVVSAYRTGAVVELKKWVRRNRGLAASLVAALVIALAGLGGVSYVQTEARADVEEKNAELEATNLELEAERERTAAARDLARENEEVALANEREALWQSYVGNVGAALASLEIGSSSEARRRLEACLEEHRDWEWRYLTQRAGGSLRTLTGARTFQYTLDVHPFDELVASAGGTFGDIGDRDYAIRVWNFDSGEIVQVLKGHKSSVLALAFSPGGDAIASSDDTGRVAVWDLESGTLFAEAEELGDVIAFHPNGRWIAAATSSTRVGEPSVRLWDFVERKQVARGALEQGTNAVRCSPDGERIALAGVDGKIRILDGELSLVVELDASAERRSTDGMTVGYSGPGVRDLDFSPDGRRIVSASDDGFLRTWDVETGERTGFFRGHRSPPLSVRWHPSGPWIVSSDEAGTLRFWDAETTEPLDVLRGHSAPVSGLGFSAPGDRLLSASVDSTVRVWDAQPGATDTVLHGFAVRNFGPYRLAFSRDGGRVAWRRNLDQLAITDVVTGEQLCALWMPDGYHAVIKLHFGDDELVALLSDGDLVRWNARTGELVSRVRMGLRVRVAAFDEEGSEVAVSAFVEEKGGWIVTLMDVATGAVRWSADLSGRPSFGLFGFAREETRLLVGSPGKFTAFDVATGETLWDAGGHVRSFGLAVDPAGEWFATTSYNQWDNKLSLFSIETGALLRSFVGHAQPALLDVSPDGSRVFSGNWDGTISIWSPERGEILTLPAHDQTVYNVAVSPDGSTLASLSADRRFRLWNATPVAGRLAARTAAAARRLYKDDARRRVDALYEKHLHKQAVVEALQEASGLERPQRAAAILEARSRNDSPSILFERAIEVVCAAGRTPTEYLRALEAAEVCAELAPDGVLGHGLLGAAQYRMGEFERALASFERADVVDRTFGTGEGPGAAGLFFRAMTFERLGRTKEARSHQRQGGFTLGSSPSPERDKALQEECVELMRER